MTRGYCLFPDKPLIDTIIPLDKKGYVLEREVKVKKEGKYGFILKFISKSYEEDNGTDYSKLHKYIKGDSDTSSAREMYLDKAGTPIPLKLTLYRINNKDKELVLDKEYNTNGASSGGFGSITRGVTGIKLEKGLYTIRLETLKDFPKLKNRKVIYKVGIFRRKI